MSIYASLPAPCDEHEDYCAVLLYRSKRPCDCGQPDTPLVYQGSHLLPSEHDVRGGDLDIALIPSHITRDGRDDAPADGPPHPFLRFGVNESTVVLNVRQVRLVHRTLGEWLDSLGGAP